MTSEPGDGPDEGRDDQPNPFKGTPFECFLPWNAVFAVVGEDDKGMVWDEDLPDDVFSQILGELGKKAPSKPAQVIDLAAYRAKRSK